MSYMLLKPFIVFLISISAFFHLQKFYFILLKTYFLFPLSRLFSIKWNISNVLISYCDRYDSSIWSHWGSDFAVCGFVWLLLIVPFLCFVLFGVFCLRAAHFSRLEFSEALPMWICICFYHILEGTKSLVPCQLNSNFEVL